MRTRTRGSGGRETAWPKQTGLHRAALAYGTAYASVLPSQGGGVRIGVHSPRMTALYGDTVKFPGTAAVGRVPHYLHGNRRLTSPYQALRRDPHLLPDNAAPIPGNVAGWRDKGFNHSDNLPFIEAREHGIGVTPIVRYQDRWMTDGEEQHGIVEHLLGLQRPDQPHKL